jgi:hypothetical protein
VSATCPRCGLPRLAGVPVCPACGGEYEGDGAPPGGALPPAPRNAWEANARKGPNRALVALVLLVPVALVALSGWAIATGWDELVAGFEAGLAGGERPSPQPAGPEDVVRLGQVVDLVDGSDADLGSVTVLDTSRPTGVFHAPAPAGFRYVAAKVAYDARADWVYSTFDWWARDERQRRFDPESWAPPPALIDGRLGVGDGTTGWLVFVVPDEASQVWLDFVDFDGSVIFTVQIDGVPAVPPALPTEPPVLPIT